MIVLYFLYQHHKAFNVAYQQRFSAEYKSQLIERVSKEHKMRPSEDIAIIRCSEFTENMSSRNDSLDKTAVLPSSNSDVIEFIEGIS